MRDERREVSKLEPRTVALIRVATAIAKGDEAQLRERMTVARAAQVPAEWMEELLLQSLHNVGYPLTLMAFGVWREVAGPVAKAGEDLAHDHWALWKERGAKLCAEVYGRTYHKLLLNLRGLHPALEALVVVDAYGKVLSRPGLDAQRRELCTLAFTGSTREEVDQVLALVEQDLDATRALKVWELWADVRERNL